MHPHAACILHSCHLFYTICEMKLSVDSAGATKPLAQIVCVFVCVFPYTVHSNYTMYVSKAFQLESSRSDV